MGVREKKAQRNPTAGKKEWTLHTYVRTRLKSCPRNKSKLTAINSELRKQKGPSNSELIKKVTLKEEESGKPRQ